MSTQRVSARSASPSTARLFSMSKDTEPVAFLDMIEWSRGMSQQAFAARIGGWALVGPPINARSDDWNYRTLSARTVRDEGPNGDVLILRDTYAAFPLKKAGPGPFKDTILIGRASSNDVRLPHTSVSKLHARVRYNAEGRPSISDAGSSNGTIVQDAKLADGVWLLLDSGDVLQIGTCTFRVLDPERLYQLVQKLGA